MLFEPALALKLFFPVFLSAALFFIGMGGLLIRRNLLMALMSLELMLSAVNLNFLSLSKIYGFEEGPVFIFFIICIAAAEAGVGLALAVKLFRQFKSLEISKLNFLKD